MNELEDGYYWMKESGEPWRVVEIAENEMYFTGDDISATLVAGGEWKNAMGGVLHVEQLVKIELPNQGETHEEIDGDSR
jgi:hypothetical protein